MSVNRAVTGACLLLLSVMAASGPVVVHAKQANAVPVIDDAATSEALSRRIAESRRTGIWTVQEGDHLYRIARHFFPDDRVMIERVRTQLIVRNAHAFLMGKPGLLIVGAKLNLPIELIEPAQFIKPATPVKPSVPVASGAPKAAPPSGQPAASTSARTPTTATIPAAAVAQADTVITRLDPGVPAARPATQTVTPPAYVDKVIEGLSGSDESVDIASEQTGRPGRRTLSAGLSHVARDRTGSTSRDTAIDLRLTTETLDHGDFRLDLQGVRFQPGPQDLLPSRRSINGTLFHSQFPLPGGVTADSAVGVVRSLQPLWLSSSARVVLPSTLMSGFTTRLGSDRGEARFAYGEPGRLAGVGILDFERTSGRFASAAGSYALAPGWQAGGALVRLTGSNIVPDHTAVTAAIDYAPSSALRGKTQLLANAGGNRGVWSDWEINHQRWRHRTGVYHLDPDLLFGDSRPQSDVRGAYWRSELRRGFNTFVVGVDSNQTNIRNDAARSGTASDGAYGSAALRLDRNTSVGASLSLRKERPRQGSALPREVVVASAFGSRQTGLGFTRIDGTVNQTRAQDSEKESVTSVQLSHDFPRWNQVTVSSSLAMTRENLADGRVNRQVATVSLRGPLFGSIAWDANLSWVNVDSEGEGERGYNANVGMDWPISSNWAANLSWQRNQVRPGADNPLSPFRRDNTVLLSVRYDAASGVPYPRMAGPGGRLGSGNLSGAVFYDENGDGVRQPSERGAENILLVLDGRFSTTTNREGYYTFGPVSLGTHAISVQLERVPLPWGLSDESPRQVVVKLREESRVDIGLTRISP